MSADTASKTPSAKGLQVEGFETGPAKAPARLWHTYNAMSAFMAFHPHALPDAGAAASNLNAKATFKPRTCTLVMVLPLVHIGLEGSEAAEVWTCLAAQVLGAVFH